MRVVLVVTWLLALAAGLPEASPGQAADETTLISDFDGLLGLLNKDSVTHQTNQQEQLVLIPTEKGGLDSVFVIRWAADSGIVHFIHQIPVKLPSERLSAVEVAMMRLNHAMAFPGLGINHDSRSMYFRMSIPYQPKGGLTGEEVRGYFSHTLSQSELFRPVMTAVINGETAPEDVVAFFNSAQTRRSEFQFPGTVIQREFAGSTWIITFINDRRVTVHRDDALGARSTYQTQGNQIHFSDIDGPLSVQGKGIYEWLFRDNQLTFKKIEDVSQGREMSLTTGPWSLVDQTKTSSSNTRPEQKSTSMAQVIHLHGSKVAEVTREGEVWINGDKAGEITAEGEIWVAGEKQGDLTREGEVWKAGEKVGDVTTDGEVWFDGNEVGTVDADGTIWIGSSREGSFTGGHPSQAAVVVFYGFFDLKP